MYSANYYDYRNYQPSEDAQSEENPDDQGDEREGTDQKEVPTSIVARISREPSTSGKKNINDKIEVHDNEVTTAIDPISLTSPSELTELNDSKINKPNINSDTPMLTRRQSAHPGVHDVREMFAEATSLRKKDGFEVFNHWKEACSSKFKHHRAISDLILISVYEKTNKSIEGVDNVTRFFQERQKQEEAYYNVMIDKLPSLGSAFMDKQATEAGGWTLPAALRVCEQYHNQLCQNSQEIAAFIQSAILHGILNDLQKDFAKKLQMQREQIAEAKKRVSAASGRLSKKVQKYSNLIAETVSMNSKKTKQKDFFNKELSIIASSHALTLAYRNLGSVVLSFVEEVRKIELARFEAIKRAFSIYLAKMNEVHGQTIMSLETINAIEGFKTEEEINYLFNPVNMINGQEAAYLRGLSELKPDSPLSQEQISQYLENLEHKVPAKKPLVLKEWVVLKESGIVKSFKPCRVIITVDDNILLIDVGDGKENKKADQVLKLELTAWVDKKKNNPLVAEIEETRPGFILDSKTKYVFKFNTEDEVDAFYHYVKDFRKAAPSPLVGLNQDKPCTSPDR